MLWLDGLLGLFAALGGIMFGSSGLNPDGGREQASGSGLNPDG